MNLNPCAPELRLDQEGFRMTATPAEPAGMSMVSANATSIACHPGPGVNSAEVGATAGRARQSWIRNAGACAWSQSSSTIRIQTMVP